MTPGPSRLFRTSALIGLLELGGCATEVVSATASASPELLDAQECDACGMLVNEQPSPRGQVIYRDGTHAHFCSIGDLLVALEARSPHGSAEHVFVESLPVDFDPRTSSTTPLPWMVAEEGTYVVGVSRERVMGVPVLSFASSDHAAAVAPHANALRSWSELRLQATDR